MQENQTNKKRINVGYFVKPTEFAQSHLNYALGLGFLENDRNFYIDRAYFPGYLIMSCISGKLWVEQYGKKVCVLPGQSCLMTLANPHKYYYDEDDPCAIVWLQFDGIQAAKTVSLILEKNQTLFVIEEVDVSSIIRECIKNYAKEGADSAFSLSANIYRILMIFLAGFVHSSSGYLHAPLEKKLNSYLESHIAERITLEQMAAFCHFNPSYFCRRFLNETGVTPMRYLQKNESKGLNFFCSTQITESLTSHRSSDFTTKIIFLTALRKKPVCLLPHTASTPRLFEAFAGTGGFFPLGI